MKKFVMLDDLQYELEKCTTRKEIDKFIKKHRKVQLISDLLINTAEDRIKAGEYEAGIAIMLAVYESRYLNDFDDVTLYLRLAEYYIENDDTDKGKSFLTKMCNETVDNYEEALSFRTLLPVWEKYKSLVAGQVQPSVSLDDVEYKTPTSEELLDIMLSEVESGGFDAYLSYHSKYFEETIKAAESLNKTKTAALLKRVEGKFPDGKIPKNQQETEQVIMDMALDFEDEDNYFYNVVEKELLDL